MIKQNKDGSFTSRIKRKKEIITIRLNSEEHESLLACSHILNQPKNGTAFKQMAELGKKVIQGENVAAIYMSMAHTIIENKRKNNRTGLFAQYI